MTELELVESERAAMMGRLKKMGGKLKSVVRRPHRVSDSPSAKALREAGVPEADVVLLLEAHEHEVRAAKAWGEPARLRTDAIPARIAQALDVLQEAEPTVRSPRAPARPRDTGPASLAAAHALIEARLRPEHGPLAAHQVIERRRVRLPSAPAGADLHGRLARALVRP